MECATLRKGCDGGKNMERKGESVVAIGIGLITKDLDTLGLGKWNESNLKKYQLKELAKIRGNYQKGKISQKEYKMMAKDVLRV